MRSWAWLLPVLFSFIYGIAGLYILAIAPDYYTRCDEDPHPHTCSRYPRWAAIYFQPSELSFAGLEFIFLSAVCLLLAVFARRPPELEAHLQVGKTLEEQGIKKISARVLIVRFAFSSWAYALAVSLVFLLIFVIQASAYASALTYSYYEGGLWRWAQDDPTVPERGAYGETTVKKLLEDPDFIDPLTGYISKSFPQPWPKVVWNFIAHTPGYYTYEFIRQIAQWGNVAAAPTVLYACLFRDCRGTRKVALPLLATLWFAYVIVRRSIFEIPRIRVGEQSLSNRPSSLLLYNVEAQLVPEGYKKDYEDMYWSELIAAGGFSIVGLLGTMIETREDGCRAWVWSCITATMLPWMCYAQTGLFNNLVFGGNPCPYGVPGSIWFKAQSNWTDKLLVRFFLVQGFGMAMAYGAKLLTQDHLPLGVKFPIRSGLLRFVLPVYFLSFWGLVGRIMQTSFSNPVYTFVAEILLVGQELLQMWAYMHQKGPIAFTLSLMRGKNVRVHADEAESPAEIRSLYDIPSRALTYNFLICAHAVTEALTVLTSAFIPLAYNVNVAGFDPVDRETVVTNLLIGLIGETVLADGILCIIASRKERHAHTFLATWQMRPKGSIFAFVAVTCAAFCPIWYTIMLTQTIKKDDTHYTGYQSWPSVLYLVEKHRERYNNSLHGIHTLLNCDGAVGPKANDCFYEELVNLRTHCGAPPGMLSNVLWCANMSYPSKCARPWNLRRILQTRGGRDDSPPPGAEQVLHRDAHLSSR